MAAAMATVTRRLSSVLQTCPGGVRQVNLRDQSVSVRSRFSKVPRFGVDHMTLAIGIKNLKKQTFPKTLRSCSNCPSLIFPVVLINHCWFKGRSLV